MMADDADIIDLSILASLVGSDPGKVRKFALQFLQCAEDSLDEMDAALAAADVQRLRELGHRLKSAARTVGALGMGELCEALDNLPASSPALEQAQAGALVARLRSLLAQVTGHVLHSAWCAPEASAALPAIPRAQ